VATGRPAPPDPTEPARLAEMAKRMDIRYLVITSVNRDDLPDGGAGHFRHCIDEVRRQCPAMRFEILTPDFKDCQEQALAILQDALPFVFAHNVETVPSLYPVARAGGNYERSLQLLRMAKDRYAPLRRIEDGGQRAEGGGQTAEDMQRLRGSFRLPVASGGVSAAPQRTQPIRATQPQPICKIRPPISTKSSIMLGLGETDSEVEQVLRDLRAAGCDRITIGQYLKPSRESLDVVEYVPPEKFVWWKDRAREIGFAWVLSAPFARSSYFAEQEDAR
jgi:lipoic acid synthetase